MLGDCLTRCHLEMWWLGMLSDGDMWNVGKGKTHWSYFDKCNRKACRKILCHLFSKCDSHVIAHMKFFCIQSCLYVITLLASAKVLPVKPLCQHLTDDQIWDLRCRPIWWSSKLVIMALFLPRLNVYEQTFMRNTQTDWQEWDEGKEKKWRERERNNGRGINADVQMLRVLLWMEKVLSRLSGIGQSER